MPPTPLSVPKLTPLAPVVLSCLTFVLHCHLTTMANAKTKTVTALSLASAPSLANARILVRKRVLVTFRTKVPAAISKRNVVCD